MQYGLISNIDVQVIEATLNFICSDFPDDKVIHTLEVGVYGGNTSNGIVKYVLSKKRKSLHVGIDNFKDGENPIDFPDTAILIQGNSNEVYNQVEDESLHFCLIDSCHCFTCVISDYFVYSRKVKKGGYLLFHDTGKHIAKFKDFQHGDKNNQMAYISVREALEAIKPERYGWQVVFDEADVNNEAGGIICLRKLS